MIVTLLERGIDKVLIVFSTSPGSGFTRKEIKEFTRLNNVPLDSSLKKLVSLGVLKRDRRIYRLVMKNAHVKNLIKILKEEYSEMGELPLKVYFSLIDVVRALKKYSVDVYLFGSFAKLTFHEESDIDIAIIGDVERDVVVSVAKKIANKYGTKLQLHFFGKDFYGKLSDPFVRDVLRNGKKLLSSLPK